MDAANEIFAAGVVRVRLAAEDDLQRTDARRDLGEPLEVGEEQVGALVRRGAPREADREHLRIERDAGAALTAAIIAFLASACAARISLSGMPTA